MGGGALVLELRELDTDRRSRKAQTCYVVSRPRRCFRVRQRGVATGAVRINIDEPHLSVSERTLRYAFRNVLGMSPVAYLTRLRLHRVHKSLKEATRSSTTVTTEALRWGFWHVGDFSKAYKECFGELPSDTLAHEP